MLSSAAILGMGCVAALIGTVALAFARISWTKPPRAAEPRRVIHQPLNGCAQTCAGHVCFATQSEKGEFGELATRVVMASRRARAIPSKTGKIHGADGVFVRDLGDGFREIIIAETKTTTSGTPPRATPGQMSTSWILNWMEDWRHRRRERDVEELVTHIRAGLDDLPKTSVRRQLWAHDLLHDTTRIYGLDSNGHIIALEGYLEGVLEPLLRLDRRLWTGGPIVPQIADAPLPDDADTVTQTAQ